MEELSRTLNKQIFQTGYQYNNRGQLVEKELPDGQVIEYQYNDSGQLSGIYRDNWLGNTTLVEAELATPTTSSSGSASRIISYRYGNGISSNYYYKNRRLERIQTDGGYDFIYQYNPAGKIIGIDNGEESFNRYRYDEQGRIDFALTPAALYGYQYVENGNRTRKVTNGRHFNYSYADNSNRLATTSFKQYEKDFSYTETGNPSRYFDYEFAYNDNDQLASVSLEGKLIAEYQYNSQAERISKTLHLKDGGQQTTYYLNENKKISAEIDANGNITRQYLYSGNRPISMLEGKTVYTVHSNHLGAPVAVSNPQGERVWHAQYTPFGGVVVDEDPDKDDTKFSFNLRLPGQYEDEGTGLPYKYYRYYDPANGRSIRQVPLGP